MKTLKEYDLPLQMILDHGDHRVLDVLLLVGQALVRVLLELLGQGLDDDVRVADLLAVQLDEGQEAALRAELRVVSHVLKVGERTRCRSKPFLKISLAGDQTCDLLVFVYLVSQAAPLTTRLLRPPNVGTIFY